MHDGGQGYGSGNGQDLGHAHDHDHDHDHDHVHDHDAHHGHHHDNGHSPAHDHEHSHQHAPQREGKQGVPLPGGAGVTGEPGPELEFGKGHEAVHSIRFDDAVKRQPLFRAPITRMLHSGKVMLAPGESVGIHTTAEKEELLVFLKGRGVARAAGRQDAQVCGGMMVCFPPDTVHDIRASENEGLEYVYIVAKTR